MTPRSFLPLCFCLVLGLVAVVVIKSNNPADAPQAKPAQDTGWVMQIPFKEEQRRAVLQGLGEELQADASSAWSLIDGCPRVPSYPAAMAAAGERLYVVTEARLESFDLASRSWASEPLKLREPVGSGLVLLGQADGRLFLVSGGESRSIWELSPEDGRIHELPKFERGIGIGAALAEWKGELYLAPGMASDDFWVLRAGAESWVRLGRIGAESTLDTAFGRNCGFLATLEDSIYAWPNHHIHKFNAASQDWRHGPEVNQPLRYGNWVAMNFVPTYDGGGVATATGVNSIFSIAGFFSRSLNEINPKQKKAYFLRPRLPYPIIGEGDRLTIVRLKGVPYLVVYALEPDNKLCSIPLSSLERVNLESDQADLGSAWRRFHTEGGGNGVRHWTTRVWKGEPGPMSLADRKGGTLGVMGAMGDELFTMRRAFTRRIIPGRNVFSYYPGVNLGEYLGLGAAGVFDGEGHVYFMTGRSDYFLRRELPKGMPHTKAPKSTLAIDETDLELLPKLPEVVGRCASLAHMSGSIYALRGGATRTFWRYDLASSTWEVLPPLPESALPIGERGGGLVEGLECVFAVSGDQVWRYDLGEGSWSRFATLGFGVEWDGGMLAGDAGRHLYVARGKYSTRLGRVDLTSGVFEELYPRLPDAVSAEGNRMAVIDVAGERRLYLHRGHNSNEILWIPLADLGAK